MSKSKWILVLPVSGPPFVVAPDRTVRLEDLQAIVGGYIETIPSVFFPAGSPLRRLAVFGDEEARIKNPPKTRSPWTEVVTCAINVPTDVLGDLALELPRADHPAIEWAKGAYAARVAGGAK